MISGICSVFGLIVLSHLATGSALSTHTYAVYNIHVTRAHISSSSSSFVFSFFYKSEVGLFSNLNSLPRFLMYSVYTHIAHIYHKRDIRISKQQRNKSWKKKLIIDSTLHCFIGLSTIPFDFSLFPIAIVPSVNASCRLLLRTFIKPIRGIDDDDDDDAMCMQYMLIAIYVCASPAWPLIKMRSPNSHRRLSVHQ